MLRDDSMKKSEYMDVYLTTESGDNNVFASWNLLPGNSKNSDWDKVNKSKL